MNRDPVHQAWEAVAEARERINTAPLIEANRLDERADRDALVAVDSLALPADSMH